MGTAATDAGAPRGVRSFGGFPQTQLNEMAGFLSPSQLAGLGAAVPEPTSLGLLALGAVSPHGRKHPFPTIHVAIRH